MKVGKKVKNLGPVFLKGPVQVPVILKGPVQSGSGFSSYAILAILIGCHSKI